MRLLYICLFSLTIVAVMTLKHEFNEYNNPINTVETSNGVFDYERVEYIEATILPRHISSNFQVDFTIDGPLNERFINVRYPGDVAAGLIGSQFSGPAEWYNLTPYNGRVNRKSGYLALTPDWFKFECEVRLFLNKGSQGGERYVTWVGNQTYLGNSNRPDVYFLNARFYHNDRLVDTKTAQIRNPFLKQDSNFWTCECTGERKRRPSRCTKDTEE